MAHQKCYIPGHQTLRVSNVLPKDPSLVPSTHAVWLTTASGIQHSPLDSVTPVYMCQTHRYVSKIIKENRERENTKKSGRRRKEEERALA